MTTTSPISVYVPIEPAEDNARLPILCPRASREGGEAGLRPKSSVVPSLEQVVHAYYLQAAGRTMEKPSMLVRVSQREKHGAHPGIFGL